MKKFLGLAMIAALLVGVALTDVQAQGVYSRDDGAASVTAGSGVYTNSRTYEPVELKRVWVYGSLATNGTITVTRIDSGGAITQACASVALAANSTAGNSATFTAAYLKPGDMLGFSSSLTTGFSYRVEFEVQGLR